MPFTVLQCVNKYIIYYIYIYIISYRYTVTYMYIQNAYNVKLTNFRPFSSNQ